MGPHHGFWPSPLPRAQIRTYLAHNFMSRKPSKCSKGRQISLPCVIHPRLPYSPSLTAVMCCRSRCLMLRAIFSCLASQHSSQEVETKTHSVENTKTCKVLVVVLVLIVASEYYHSCSYPHVSWWSLFILPAQVMIHHRWDCYYYSYSDHHRPPGHYN